MARDRNAAHTLVAAASASDILPDYLGTPIETLLRYHNLGEPLPDSYGKPVLLVGMHGSPQGAG